MTMTPALSEPPRSANKKWFRRPNGTTASRVCYYWKSGRCTRRGCPFLHGEPPTDASAATPSFRKRKNVWKRNPETKNSTPAPKEESFKGENPRNNTKNPNSPPKGGYKRKRRESCQPNDIVCRGFIAGSCTDGESCGNRHVYSISDSFSLLARLEGHSQAVTGIALPSGSNMLFSGSKDKTVKVWDCGTGQCAQVITMEGEVGCLITEGPWVFVGIPNAVKAWNLQTGLDLSLEGPKGQVYALMIGNETLFAGAQDGSISAWKSNADGKSFELAVTLGGHLKPVVSLIVGAMKLYSGSMDGTIRILVRSFLHVNLSRDVHNKRIIYVLVASCILRFSVIFSKFGDSVRLLSFFINLCLGFLQVWDVATLQCTNTFTGHQSVVTSLLCWEDFLLSCSLDQTVKAWRATETEVLEVTHTHTEEHGVLALRGVYDDQGKPVLLCSCNDNSVHAYNLPSFRDRGRIFSKEEVRAIQIGPHGLFFTGDGTGDLKVWKWLSNEKSAS
ncbi:zinc finger CCCH domain-containing protein 17-like [Typha angustifolia]|uniref:zinc finger CCCH domain-containing protein 17-like n=1 Tax=Typha angustifolia TaxID=59011 RepID=UPI003C2F72FF